MAYDEDLAARTRECLAELTPDVVEKKMFGGLAFMVATNMACGITGPDLMVRVGPDGYAQALARGAREMDVTGRTMRGFVVVPGEELADPEVLDSWVREGARFARALPRKQPKG